MPKLFSKIKLLPWLTVTANMVVGEAIEVDLADDSAEEVAGEAIEGLSVDLEDLKDLTE